ncbi:MAG: hypothetical protein EA370_13490 [Wenzhouxiangella sp.]|nr:MAG: hypothetical protein EA370_13490 [Wenzhouxiangella sp.]
MSELALSPPDLRSLDAGEKAAKQAMLRLLEEDRVRLLTRQPFVAALAMRMDVRPVIDFRLPTAATDGKSLFFSVPFMASLDESERLFIMAHEVWHCAALHFARRGNREPERWNIAVDHEVNHILIEQGFSLPRGGIHFPVLAGENAETVYERLPEKLPDRGPMADLHEPQAGGVPTAPGDSMQSDTDDQGGQGYSASGSHGLPIDPDYAPDQDGRIWREWPRRVHAAAQQVYRQAGDRPGWLKDLLEMHGRPSLPWQEILRRFVERIRSDHYRWSPPNRRHAGQGLILPGRSGARLSLAVAIDTSGSTATDMPRFLAELRGILASHGRFELRLIGCDVRVHYDRTFTDDQPFPDHIELGGGGGTELSAVFEKLKTDPPRALVFLTDGYTASPGPNPGYPVLWCLTTDGQNPSSWGETLRLPARG